jgi:cell division protease FtsH
VGGVLLLIQMAGHGGDDDNKKWSEFAVDLDAGKYESLIINKTTGQLDALLRGKEKEIHHLTLPPGGESMDRFLITVEDLKLRNEIDEYTFKRDSEFFGNAISILLPIALIIFFYMIILRPMRGGGGIGSALSFGRSRAKNVPKGKTGVTFDDVAGIDEAKEDVQEIIEFLKNPDKFQALGGHIPHGVLLVGPPGTGKTLLAKAIAGEADVPFFSISGSDFVEMFVGVGASRVRDLFAQAKAKAPCIIFVDEIDAVGRKRGSGVGGGGDEREQTLNAILVEMDGFGSDTEVIVIAATNRADVLDQALLRPGRFDRQIHVDLPDVRGREQILKVHSKNVTLVEDIDLRQLALSTAGFSGADLAATVNEAALSAVMKNKEAVSHAELMEARDKIAFGKSKHSRMAAMTEEDKRVTAYHEAGHAVLSEVLPEAENLYKVTIIPTGRALGMTMFIPEREHIHVTKRKLFSHIVVAFGGRIAEDIYCGDISTGAQNDIKVATRIARAMVVEYGMSEKLGPINYQPETNEIGMSSREHGGKLQEVIDLEVNIIIDDAYKEARRLIEENGEFLDAIAKNLMIYEILDRDDLDAIKNGESPSRPTSADDDDMELTGPQVAPIEDSEAEQATDGDFEDDLGLTPAL